MTTKVVAEHDYEGDSSQLSFKTGDVIVVLEEDDSGWWTGRLEKDGKEGYFPSTYVKPYTDIQQEIQNGPPPPPMSTQKNNGAPSSRAKPPPKSKKNGYQTQVDVEAPRPKKQRTYSNYKDVLQLKRQPTEEQLSQKSGDVDPLMDNYYSGAVLNLKVNPNAKTRFGLAAHYMALASSITCVFLGFSGMLWGGNDASKALKVDAALATVCGVYCFFLGIIFFIYEWVRGGIRPSQSVPVRAIIYFVLGIFPLVTIVTALGGAMFVVTGIWEFMAWMKKEEYTQKKKKPFGEFADNRKKWTSCDYWCEMLTGWYTTAKQQSKLKKYVFLGIYLIFNVAYTLERAYYYSGIVSTVNRTGKKSQNSTDLNKEEELYAKLYRKNKNDLVLGDWYPVAKMFGNLLDINCAFIVLPVCRSFIRILYNKSTDQRRSSRALNFVLSWIPLDKALQFHKVCAFLTVIGTVFHGWAHYNHYAQVPETYEAVFGPTVWISGVIIIMSMFFLYSTSFQQVRHGKFELFWYTHHLFVVFFLTILFHGAGSVNPNFWKWFLVPGFIYLVERIMREIRASKPIGVVSVTHMNNVAAKVYCLELEKKPGQPTHQHQEGQYVFICAPIISKYQWHPFTISSPPDQKTLTLHIRNMGDGTWTGRLQDFFQALAPRKAYAELFHREAFSLVPQTKAPDGSNLICVDGPMAAPTQHLGEYGTSIVCGAGIGVTPVRATLLSIVFYRFKRGIGQTFPDHAYMVWIVNYKQLDAYRFMVRCLKEAEDEMYDMRAKNPKTMNEKTLQIHVFVTSAPKDPYCNLEEVANPENSRDKDLELWGPQYNQIANRDNPNNDQRKTQGNRNTKGSIGNSSLQKTEAPFSLIDIWRCLKEPQDNPIAIGDIIVHKGRPKWPELFGPIQQHHRGEKIGVMFCGPAIIAKSLKEECGNHTDFNSNTVFILHKENF